MVYAAPPSSEPGVFPLPDSIRRSRNRREKFSEAEYSTL